MLTHQLPKVSKLKVCINVIYFIFVEMMHTFESSKFSDFFFFSVGHVHFMTSLLLLKNGGLFDCVDNPHWHFSSIQAAVFCFPGSFSLFAFKVLPP